MAEKREDIKSRKEEDKVMKDEEEKMRGRMTSGRRAARNFTQEMGPDGRTP